MSFATTKTRPLKMQRTRRFNECGLSSSVYQACYPDSLTDNAKRASMVSIQAMDHSEVDYASSQRSKQQQVTFYIGEEGGQESNDDGGSCYEEECHYGLQKLLFRSLSDQILSLFSSTFGSDISVIGLAEILPPVITELLHLSVDEPYGVRGANLILVLDKPKSGGSGKSSVMSTTSSISMSGFDDNHQPDVNESDILGDIKLCSETVTTFELVLILREEKNLGVSIRNWMANMFRSKQIVVIEPNFALRKKKLYRSS